MKKLECRVILVTSGSLAEARKIARAVVEQRLAACVNITTAPVQSIYRWKEKVQGAREYLLIMKSVEKCLPGLQRAVKQLHSYDVPEFVVLPVVSGSKEYLDWLAASVTPGKRLRRHTQKFTSRAAPGRGRR
ncbi:MAG: divalent-cation tolerance protein CutA [Acidobacteriota bacterium]|nr:divalent-cation tolerance protein CutA [Acidobacteriota bacterium]